MTEEVYITGLGIISSLGLHVDQTLESFRTHRSGIATLQHLATRHQESFPCGEVPISNASLAELHQLPPGLSRTILLSYHAAHDAVSHLPESFKTDFRVGFISASTVGGMDKTEDYFSKSLVDPNTGVVQDTRNHDCGKPTDYVFKLLGLKGFVSTVSTACSSSANAIMLGARMLRTEKLDIILAGGVDALTRFTLNGFSTLMIVDQKQCRPLDKSRTGLNLGEGAAYVVMMRSSTAKKLGLEGLSRLTGFANTNDTFHQTALSNDGNGPFAAMKMALTMANIQPEDVSYINLHGTGTPNNDMAEGNAIKRIFHPVYPMLSSTKSFTGHTLGASGAIESVLSVLAIQHGVVYPNFSFCAADEGVAFRPVTKYLENQKINHVLSNSFGFGGNCTSLLFSSL